MLENSTFPNFNCSLIEGLSDTSIPVLSMDTWSTSILITMIVGCVVTNTFGKLFTIYYIKERAPERPLNDMIFIDQCLQLPPSLLHGTMVILSVLTKKPLVHIFGDFACVWMYANSAFHNTVLGINGTGMAFYRLFAYKMASQTSIKELEKVKHIIVWFELIIGVLIYGLFLLATYYTNIASHLDFCRGYSRDLSYIISVYQEENLGDMKFGQTMKSLALVIGQFLVLFEILCYVIIMVSLFWHDINLAKIRVIEKKVMKKRTKKNAITLTGQFLSFMVELGYLVLVLVLYDLDGWGIFKYENISILVIFCWTAITVTQIGTSPEMRRFIIGAKVDVAPTHTNLLQILNVLSIAEKPILPTIEMEMKTI